MEKKMTNTKFYDGPIYFAPTVKPDGSYILHKSSPKAPAAPDYRGAAEATSKSDMEQTKYQTNANRADQYTPWGSLTWSRTNAPAQPTFDQARYDADMAAYNERKAKASQVNPYAAGMTFGQSDMGGFQQYNQGGSTFNEAAPNRDNYYTKAGIDDGSGWVQTINLTPAQQAALEQEQLIQKNQMNLAGQLQTQVANTMKNPFVSPDLAKYMKDVGTVGNFDPNAYGPVKEFVNDAGALADFNYTGPGAPQFSEANRQQGMRAAWEYANSMTGAGMAAREKELDVQLRLQGLVPGSEAYNNSWNNLIGTNNRQQQDQANAAILTGTDMANRDYMSALQGQQTAFGQALSGYTTNRDTQGQRFDQSLAGWGANLQGQNQRYGQGLQGFQANLGAQDQRFNQAQQGYQTAYTSALQRYLQPLNNMNAVIHGQQVAQPTFEKYTPAGKAMGTNYSAAASALGDWNQGVYNRDAASAAQGNASMLGGVASIAGAFL